MSQYVKKGNIIWTWWRRRPTICEKVVDEEREKMGMRSRVSNEVY